MARIYDGPVQPGDTSYDAAERAAHAGLGPDGWPTCDECGRSSELQTPDGLWHCAQHYATARPCEWFALCDRPSDGYVVDHPVLGEVPTCDHCASAHNLHRIFPRVKS